MARDKNPSDSNPDTTPADAVVTDGANATTEGTPAPDGAATPEETKVDERYRMVTRPGTSELVKRKDYILELWTGKVTSSNPTGKKFDRSAIAKHLSKLLGKKIPYQIVFAATKGVAGGPAKDTATGENVEDPVAAALGTTAPVA